MTNPTPSTMIIRFTVGFLFAASCAFLAQGVNAQVVELEAAADNTLFESSDGSLSNGAGDYLFTGSTNRGLARRALIRFDLDGALPEGATVDSVTLQLTMSKTIVGATDVAVHRVLAPWGEGASDAIGQEGSGTSSEDGDATWIHTFFSDQSWQNPGGDFADSSSAVATIDDFGRYSWTTTPALIEDVTSWIESPDGNSGWILVGDETTSPTAKRFDSRTNSNEENRPSLRVVYSVATAAEGQLPGSSAEIVSAWPNPFSERSTIRLSLRQAGEIEVDVFDVTGRRVSTLANGWRPQGTHAFHFESGALPAGLYVVRALHRPDAGTDSGGKVLTTKVVLTR